MMTAATTTQATTATPVEATAKSEWHSIKFHLSSVSNSLIFTALKQHLTTWRQKLTSPKGSSTWNKSKSTTPPKAEHQQSQPKEETQIHCHHHSGKWFRRSTRKEYCFSCSNTTTTSSTATSFVQRTSVYSNVKLLQFSTATSSTSENTTKQFTTSTIGGDRKGPRRRYGRKVEIVANLLSLNLIQSDKLTLSPTSTDDPCIQRRGSADSGCLSIDASDSILTSSTSDSLCHSNQDFVELVESSVTSSATNTTPTSTADKMTITELTFLEIRDENPELDSEIRSILTTRAQEGATISEIRDDYRKLTGLVFPVYECITDFLLSIPYVSAYCNENGTRIFNIRPMDKTKHIHNMVVQQKPTQEHAQRSYNNNQRPYYRERQRNSNYYPSNWRQNNSFRNRKQPEQNQYYHQQQQTQQQQQTHQQQTQQQQQTHKQQQQQPQPLRIEDEYFDGDQQNRPDVVVCNDPNLIIETTEDFIDHNCCYNDNCNYLLKRICNQDNIVESTPNPILLQTIAPPTMYTWDEQHQPLISEKTPPPPTVTDLNNLNDNATCYDNNINHFNSLFHKGNLMNNGVSRSRRSLKAPPKGPMLQPRRSTSPTVKSSSTNDSMFTDTDYDAHLLDFLLLGDDLLLFMARMELGCKFKQNQKVLQSGLCVSGQTINAATRRISNLNASGRSVIVNIGSVNILQCRQLIQIEHDYRELIMAMVKKGIKPILTTLAPLANYSHEYELKLTLERFNEFIKREAKRMDLVVIDIWKCLVNEKGQVRFDCYQNAPRIVTGAKESYLFWNKIGRQRVLNLIESHLEY